MLNATWYDGIYVSYLVGWTIDYGTSPRYGKASISHVSCRAKAGYCADMV